MGLSKLKQLGSDSMVVSQDLLKQLQADDPEARQIISGVSWAGYEALLNKLGDSLRYRVTYLDGMLELVSPSHCHERNKTLIGSLLEDYFKEKRIRFFPTSSTTFRQEAKRGGVRTRRVLLHWVRTRVSRSGDRSRCL